MEQAAFTLATVEIPVRGVSPLATRRLGYMAGQADPSEGMERNTFRSDAGWFGFPAMAPWRACRTVACRLGVADWDVDQCMRVEPDGYDAYGCGLVRLAAGEPEPVDPDSDGGPRPSWREWSAVIKVAYDKDILTEETVRALLGKAGAEVGICDGRLPQAAGGKGRGLFELV